MTINKDKVKKYLYPASFVLFILLIATLTSKTKTFKVPTNTVPVFDKTSQSLQKNTNTNIIENIPPATNLTPTDFGEAKIENNQIVIGQKIVKIDDKINSYSINTDLIVIESGDIYGENKTYYFYDLSTDISKKITTEKIKQIVSYSIEPVSRIIYFLGNYNTKTDSSSLYSYNIQTEKFTLLESQIAINKVHTLNSSLLALVSEKHGPEINVKTKLYKVDEKKYVTPEILTSENLYCINSSQLVSYNLQTKTFTETNLNNHTQKTATSGLVTDAMHLFCNNTSYFLVEKQEDKTIFNILAPDFNLVSKKEVKNTTQKTYIQSFIHNEKLINKYLDKTKDLFYLSQD